MPALKAAGIKIIHKCTRSGIAPSREDRPATPSSVEWLECGGHPGEDDVPNMILLPSAPMKS